MTGATKPAVLICDVGDTLIRWTGYDRRAGLLALQRRIDRPERFDPDQLEETGIELDGLIEPRAEESRLEYREADFLRLLFGRLGMRIDGDDDEVESLYWQNTLTFEAEPGVADALTEIRSAGVRLGILSNTPFGPRAIEYELRKQGLAHVFERPFVTSARFGLRKPEPSIFTAARSLLAQPDESVWYVGNSVYHDVLGAVSAEMPVVWYNEDGEPDHLLNGLGGSRDIRPDYQVRSWKELSDLICR